MRKSQPAWDAEQWLSTTELLGRGWARQWLPLLLGESSRSGVAKLWPRQLALQVEQHPVFIEAVAQLADIARRARYVTKAHEIAALGAARARYEAGELPVATMALDIADIAPIADAPAASAFPQANWSADAITLVWECGGKVVVPTPFLEALRHGMGETNERLSLAISTVLTDWRVGRVMPEKLQWGRNYFLGAVRRTLEKLQELETPAARPAMGQDEPPAPPAPGRVLH